MVDKIGQYTSTADSNDEFTEGNPSAGVPATEVTEGWLNGVQRELLKVITSMGLSPSTSNDNLVWKALEKVWGKTYAGDPNGNVAADVLRERCWDTSKALPELYIATAADGTAGGTTWTGPYLPSKDEDDMASESDQHVPTQQSVAAFVGSQKLSSGSFSGASVDVSLPSGYSAHILVINTLHPDTDASSFQMRLDSANGGGDYEYVTLRVLSTGATAGGSSSSEGLILSNMGSDTDEIVSCVLEIYQARDPDEKTIVHARSSFISAGGNIATRIHSIQRTATVDDETLNLLMSSGNFLRGNYTLYGMR